MTKTVDARGLPCPQPVIQTRNAMRESMPGIDAAVTAIVDNEIAQQNVTRMAEKAGATVKVEMRDDGIYLHITQGEMLQADAIPQPVVIPVGGPLVLVIPSESMGRGDAELGQILIRGFFHTLGEVEPLPHTIIFFNSGVKLVAEGSPVLEDLQNLCGQGIEILACGTCLGHYDLKDKIVVGEVSNMYTIAETMLGAGKVINL
ncbi:MAG: sulfurtransferase-like selenium metabolism protein YedF [Chloroflexi bacterium]|nr:sulfurtransferase-like selenium metabolism protein YedF [Chloroflexota bacterium]